MTYFIISAGGSRAVSKANVIRGFLSGEIVSWLLTLIPSLLISAFRRKVACRNRYYNGLDENTSCWIIVL